MRLTSLAIALRSMSRLSAPVAALLDQWGRLPKAEAHLPAIAEPTLPNVHIVREGDSIVRIAQQYGLSAYRLMVANPQLLPTTGMIPGQRIALPSTACRQARTVWHPAPARPRGRSRTSRRAGELATI